MFKIILSLIIATGFLFSEDTCSEKMECLKKGTELFEVGKEKESIKFYKKSCELGMGLGCSFVASYIEKTTKDNNKALKLFKKGCELKDRFSCEYAAERIYKAGNKLEALELYNQSCQLKGYRACEILGAKFLKGDIVEKDFDKGYLYISKACEEGKIERSCKLLNLLTSAQSK